MVPNSEGSSQNSEDENVDEWTHYANVILFSLFVIHYVNRCIVYPLRMSKGSTRVNLSVLSSAFLFCTINGFLQAQNYCQFQTYSNHYHRKIHFRLGVIIWLIGFGINLQSDSILRNLRKKKPKSDDNDTLSSSTTATAKPITPKYKIPHGGFFQYVSCANFFGEILEWLGYAIASSCFAAWAFWCFVCANLIPRGIAHHEWYLNTFEAYPKDRYAVIPFVV